MARLRVHEIQGYTIGKKTAEFFINEQYLRNLFWENWFEKIKIYEKLMYECIRVYSSTMFEYVVCSKMIKKIVTCLFGSDFSIKIWL